MSGQMMASALYTQGLRPSEKLVLMLLSERTARDVSMSPPISGIAIPLGITPRAVQLALRRLEARGMVETTRRTSKPNTYAVVAGAQ